MSSSNTGSDETFRTIQTWLTRCESHPKCHAWHAATSPSNSLPTRLLELISPIAGTPTIRLVLGRDLYSQTCRYATLSHCWGEDLPVRLMQQNFESFQSEISWESLPLTFQDTFIALQKLDIKYVWIDSLCIIQDSEEDWAREAGRMTDVYLNGYVNISADSSSNSRGGLFRERDPGPCQSTVVPCSSSELGNEAFCFYSYSWGGVEHAPLNERAWVIQERFLASKVIHFCDDQVHWECAELWTSEGLPEGFNPEPHLLTHPKSDLIGDDHILTGDIEKKYRLWDQIVETYSSAKLSVAKDRSVAISGLAGTFCHCLGLEPSDYVCGLWRPRFGQEIMWFTNTTYQSKRVDSSVPSWSWLSVSQHISRSLEPHYPLQTLESITELVEANTSPRGDPFGPVVSGYVKVRGPLCQATVSKLSKPFVSNTYGTARTYHIGLTIGNHLLRQTESFQLLMDEVSAHRMVPSGDSGSFVNADTSAEDAAAIFDQTVFLLLCGAGRSAYSEVDVEKSQDDSLSDATTTERRKAPFYGAGNYECLVLVPTKEPKCFRRVGYVKFSGNVMNVVDDEEVRSCRLLDKCFHSKEIPQEMYEEVTEDFMYTITLI